jgi:catechol 2,3-dioxygenase-like lactoylglutathione lyase family enzyme
MSNSSRDLTGLLHHVEINVSDLARSRAFWAWLLGELGYMLYQDWPEGVSWKLGATYLVFVQTPQEHLHRPYHRRGTGLNHLAFHARSREHVDRLTDELRRRDVSILYADQHPHAGGPEHYAVFFEDPDRIKVELVAPDATDTGQ